MMPDKLFHTGYIILGAITVLLGGFLPTRFLMPNKKKYRILDEKRYINSSKFLLYLLGTYYILLGTVLLFINDEPSYTIYLILIFPFSIFLPLIFIWKKYIRPLREEV